MLALRRDVGPPNRAIHLVYQGRIQPRPVCGGEAMRTLHESVVQTFIVLQCGNCGVEFAMPERLNQDRIDHGTTFYCPNGHPRGYVETTEQKLAKAQRRAAGLERENRQAWELAEERARELRRVKRRANAGVCQYCHRSFSSTSLTRHIKTQHPGEASELAHS